MGKMVFEGAGISCYRNFYQYGRKLTIEEVRELSEPEKEYEDENGIRYELKHWELQEKEGEESTRTLEKRVEYPKVEAAEEVPEIILADETDP